MTQTLLQRRKPRPVLNGRPTMHRFSVDDYHQMIAAGILTTNDKVELLDGWIVDKMPQNPPHITAVTRFDRWLGRLLPEEKWTVRVRGPVTLLTSEPEPDIAVARGPDKRYVASHPRPVDIALLIEMADSTLIEDREGKGSVYAAAKIPVYWLVNLVDGCVECFTKPQAGRHPAYRNIRIIGMTDILELVLDGEKHGELKLKQLIG